MAAAKGMALAEFLVKIGFNTAQINKQLDMIEARLDGILKTRKTVTGQALKDEKALLDIKKKELDIAGKESRLAATRARTAAAEARARLTTARATERVERATRRAEPLPPHPGRSYLNRRAREARQAAREQALQGPQHPGKDFLRRRAKEAAAAARAIALQGPPAPARLGSRLRRSEDPAYIQARKSSMIDRLEIMRRGGKISASHFSQLSGEITGANSLRALAVARSNLANAALHARQLRSELTLANVASQRLASSTRQMIGNYVSTFAMAGGAAMASRSSMAVESARAQLYGANFGDQGAANADYDFFRQMSLQYGTGMAESIKSFSGFKYAGGNIMDTAQMRELFQSVTLSGVAGGATQADMDRSFYALKQMASKGKITSEELNLQLAEANPLAKLGIEKAFEEFTGRDRSEMMDMMKRGEVLAKDILPLVAKHLNEISAKGVAAGMKTASKQLDIMRANAVDFAAAFGEAGGNEGLAEIFKAMTKSLKALTPVIKTVGAVFKRIGKTLAWVMGVFSKATESIAALSETFTGSGGLLHGLLAVASFFAARAKWGAIFTALSSLSPLAGKIATAFNTLLIPAIKRFWLLFFAPLAKLLIVAGILEEIANLALPDDHPMKKIGVLSAPTGYKSGLDFAMDRVVESDTGRYLKAIISGDTATLRKDYSGLNGWRALFGMPRIDGNGRMITVQNMTVVANNPEEFGTQMDAVAAGMSR